ncbi:hypothetical protein BO443_30468 [Burkholderia orbicola]
MHIDIACGAKRMTFAIDVNASCIHRHAGMHRIALIRLAFRSRHPAQPARMRAGPAAATVAPFAVFPLSIAKIII